MTYDNGNYEMATGFCCGSYKGWIICLDCSVEYCIFCSGCECHDGDCDCTECEEIAQKVIDNNGKTINPE
jgi:hypothetical protein